MLTALALSGAVILLGLAAYAASLLRQLQRQSQARNTAIRERNTRILDSVQLIARAVSEGQCELSEGAIRLTNLLDALQWTPSQPLAVTYPGLYGLYDKIKDLPTHAARRELTKQERMRQDVRRLGHEADYNDQIHDDLAKLARLTLPG
jgi:hypothetical protein